MLGYYSYVINRGHRIGDDMTKRGLIRIFTASLTIALTLIWCCPLHSEHVQNQHERELVRYWARCYDAETNGPLPTDICLEGGQKLGLLNEI